MFLFMAKNSIKFLFLALKHPEGIDLEKNIFDVIEAFHVKIQLF